MPQSSRVFFFFAFASVWVSGALGSPRAARWFRGDGSALRNIAIAPPPPGVDAIARVLEENFAFARRDARDAADFLRALLRYEPDARVSARRALDLPWLADGGDLVL